MIPNRSRHILSLLFIIFVCGCGHPVQETAAHKIADLLPGTLGPASHYDVQVDGDPFALARGRARAVHIQGMDVQLSPSVTLETLRADAHDVSYDTQSRRLSHIGNTEFSATLGQGDLSYYLAHTKPLLPGLTVTLQADSVAARIPVTFLGLHTTAALSGTLVPNADNSSKLDFVTGGAQIGVVPLPASLISLAVERLNPVVDLSNSRVPLTITRAGVANSRIELEGSVDLNGLVQP